MRIIAAGVLLLTVLLGGCSALRLAYNQAPGLVYWWIDGYADFDDEQSARARQGIDTWFAWHRRTQLPDYIGMLQRLQAEMPADTSAARTCAWWAEVTERADVALDRAVPEIAELLPSLKPDQLKHMERQYNKKNADFRSDFLDGDAAERARKNLKRTVERAETLYGRLDDAQRERLGKALAQSPFDPELWYSERRLRQQDALATIRQLQAERATKDQAQAAVRAYVQRIKRSPREDYRRYYEKVSAWNCQLSAELHNGTTPQQRQNAVDKLKGWEGDMRRLVAEVRPNGSP